MNGPFCPCAFHRDCLITNFCKSRECLLPLCPQCVSLHLEDHNYSGTLPNVQTLESMVQQATNEFQHAIHTAEVLGQALLRVHDMKKSNEVKTKKSIKEAIDRVRAEVSDQLERIENQLLGAVNQFGVATVQEIKDLDNLVQQQARNCQNNLCRLSSDALLRILILLEDSGYVRVVNEDLEEISDRIQRLSKFRVLHPPNWAPLGAIRKSIRDIFNFAQLQRPLANSCR